MEFRKDLPEGQVGTNFSAALMREYFPEAVPHPTCKVPGVWQVADGRVVTTCRGIVHITRRKTSPLAE
jgi:hypothetical protein